MCGSVRLTVRDLCYSRTQGGNAVCSKTKLDAKNLDGKTAREVAELNEQKAIVDLLDKHSS